MKTGLLERIQECHSLPTLPTVALEVLELVRSETSSAKQLAEVIHKDPALAAKLLRTVNSSLYGYKHSISSLHSAIVLLGLESVRTLVLGFSLVSGLMAHRPKGFDYLSYWRRSLYAATAAQSLAARIEPTQRETCLLAALLMDIGMLVLDDVVGEDYGEICARVATHAELAKAEIKALGISHEDVAYHLAEQWQLPDMLALPMAYHHHPESVNRTVIQPLAELVGLAARCGDIFVDAAPLWSIADVRRKCMERYKIGHLDCDAMLCEVSLRTQDLAPLFELRIEGEDTYRTILERANAQLLKATQVEGPSDERRRAPRLARNSDVSIVLCRDGVLGRSVTTQLKDISARGLGLVHSTPLSMGTQFILRAPRRGGPPNNLLYRVVHTRAMGKGEGYSIGAELQCVLGRTPAEEDGASGSAAGGAKGNGMRGDRSAVKCEV